MSQDDSKSTQKDWDAIARGTDETADSAEEPSVESSELESRASEDVQNALEHPDYTSLEAKLTEAEKKAHEYWDKATRLASEVQNTQKKLQREVEKAHKFATEGLVRDLLQVLDSLEQALHSVDQETLENDATLQGIDLTLKIFLKTLEKHNIERISAMGEMFDPNQHEAMSMQESDQPTNTVIQVLQNGYQLNGRVIRPARVIVAKGNAKASIDETV